MKKCSIERGVHTLELYLGQLSYADVDAMIEDLYDMAKKQKTPELIRQREKHPSPLKRSYEVHGLLPDGIILQIYQQFQIPSAIRIIINPSTFTSGSYIPEALYHPKEYPGVLQKVVSLLDETFSNTQEHRCWKLDHRHLSLSRVDLTWNLYLPQETEVTDLIRLFKQSGRKKKDTVITFSNPLLDKHSFRLKRGDMMLTVYDKQFQISQRTKQPVHPKKQQILRIEFTMRRKEYLSVMKLSRDMPFDQVLWRMICNRFHPRTISRETVPMYRKPLEVSRSEETHRDRISFRKNERTNAVFAQKGLQMQILNSSCGTTANGVWDIHEGDEAYLEGV